MSYRALLGLILALGVVFALLTLRQTVRQELAIDEMTYAHAGWAIAQGELPYRDFFFHHTPLLLQGLAVAFLVLGDDPTGILWLRFAMLLPLATILWASYRLNRHLGPAEALTAPALLLTLWPFVQPVIEIRPDNLAFALFLLALVTLVDIGRRDPRPGSSATSDVPATSDVSVAGLPAGSVAGLLAGGLVSAAVWASEKVLAYGSVFALGFVLDSVRWGRGVLAARGVGPRRSRQRYLLGHPLAFLGGFALVAAGATTYLAVTGSLDDFWRWAVEWSALHEKHYPGFSWRRGFARFANDYWWWCPLALLGLATSVRELYRSRDVWSHPDLLLIPALVTTLFSFTFQTAPMRYSLVPFLGVCTLFVSRGTVSLLHLLRTQTETAGGSQRRILSRRAAIWSLWGLAGILLVTCWVGLRRLDELPRNDPQRWMLATVDEITVSGDPIYDSTGSAITRPHVSFFFFNDETARRLLADRLSREVPQAVLDSGCTVAIQGPRFIYQPEAIKDFFFRHFQPYDETGVFWIWGRSFVKGARNRLEDRFLAVRDGLYFIEPPDTVDGGRLHIDGREVKEAIVELPRGDRKIVYTGDRPVFRLSWLPRNRKTFRPDPLSTKLYWPIRYRGLPNPPRSVRRAQPPPP